MKLLLLSVQLIICGYSSCGFLEQYYDVLKQILFFGALGVAAKKYYAYLGVQNIERTNPTIDPSNVAIVFDLHNVIVTLDYAEMAKKVYKKPRCLLPLFLMAKPAFLKEFYRLLRTSNVAEQYIMTLGAKYSLVNTHLDTYIELSNAQKPIPTTCEILNTLKQKNHRLFLFSNIGHKTFEQLKIRYSAILDCFEGIYVASQENNWIQKPHENSFRSFLQRFNIIPDQMLFIDDNRDNIQTAKKLGIHTIHYKSGKQLKTELGALKLL